MELSRNIKRAADRYEPVETAGLTLWPIRVCEQEEFERARPAIDVIQQALPVRYAVMPLLTAYWVMDLESMERGEEPVGLFNRALAFLALSWQKIFWHMLRKSRLPVRSIAIARPALPAKQFWIKKQSYCN